MKKLLIALTVTAVAIGCQYQGNKGNKANQADNKKETIDLIQRQNEMLQKQKNDSIQKVKEDSISKINALQFEENKKRLVVLKKNFKYEEDEFNKIGWYTHINMTNVSNFCCRKYLTTHTNSSGYIYLEDQFYSKNWIFHSRIEVKIGDRIYKSEDIPVFDENNKTHSTSSVWENISYTRERDNGIIKAIAESGENPVKVRFVGKDYYDDLTLLKSDKQTIKDSYELSNLIKKVGQ